MVLLDDETIVKQAKRYVIVLDMVCMGTAMHMDFN